MPAAVEYPRVFVPQSLDVADTRQLAPLFDELSSRGITSVAELEKWLLDLSELMSVIDEFGSRRYIEKSCHTDDKEIERRFLQFVEEVEPFVKPRFFELQKKLLDCPHRSALTDPKYAVLLRQWQADVEVFREENVPIETEITRLVTEYDKVCGAMMVDFRGQTYTQQQLARFFEEPDRATRQEAWEAGAKRRLQDRETIEALFERVLPLRDRLASNAGFPDFRAFAWKSLKRFDYTPDDCLRFADAIAEVCVPMVRELDARRARLLQLNTLRPWDVSCDELGRPPLRPFDPQDTDGFVGKTRSVFARISPKLAEDFDTLRRLGNLDLASRKAKQPGGYQSTLNESRVPFIFMNAAGVHRDVETLLHEGGHAFHALAARDEPLMFLRGAPIEFCEVASMSMELFADDHLDEFYNEADRARAVRKHLEGIVRFFPWMATIDSFQHWLYTNPGHSRAARRDDWLRLMDRFGSKIDWSGWEAVLESLWQRQMHLFHVPFYYVEYGIAQLGALQLWMKSRSDPHAALSGYRAGLKLGGTRPLPELFRAAGIEFDFSVKTLQPLISAVIEAMDDLPE